MYMELSSDYIYNIFFKNYLSDEQTFFLISHKKHSVLIVNTLFDSILLNRAIIWKKC